MTVHGQASLMAIAGSIALALVLMLVPLPDWAAMARPALYPATVLFWVLAQPGRFGIVAAWLCGLLLDVAYGTPLGQHGLALAVCAFVVYRLGNFLQDFPILQQSVLLLPLFLLYEFILFWIDGVNGRSVDVVWRWLPALTTVLVWPFLTVFLERLMTSEASA